MENETAEHPNDSLTVWAVNLHELRNAMERTFTAISRLVQNPDDAPAYKPLSDVNKKRDLRAEARACARRMQKQARITKPRLRDGAWLMMLDLYGDHHRRISITSACLGSGYPPTSALRWVRMLEDMDFVVRHSSPSDGRVVYVRLTPQGEKAVEAYLTV